MNCPLCTDRSLEAHYRAGIEIDVCPHCRGVWLDRGELDKLMAGSGPAPAPVPPQPVSADGSHVRSGNDKRKDDDRPTSGKKNKKGKKSKKKSWGELLGDVLEEVLD